MSYPHQTSSQNDTLCFNHGDAIGLRFYTHNGTPISCRNLNANTPQEFFRTVTKGDGWVEVNIPRVIEAVKLNNATALPPGLTVLNQIPKIKISSYINDRFSANIPNISNTTNMYVHSCIYSKVPIAVDFGVFPMSEIHTFNMIKDLTIKIDNCTSSQEGKNYINTMQLTFASNLIRPDGRLDIERCQNCAEGVAIELYDALMARRIYLTERTKIVNLRPQQVGDHTIEIPLKAQLTDISPRMKAGSINSVLTFILTSY